MFSVRVPACARRRWPLIVAGRAEKRGVTLPRRPRVLRGERLRPFETLMAGWH